MSLGFCWMTAISSATRASSRPDRSRPGLAAGDGRSGRCTELVDADHDRAAATITSPAAMARTLGKRRGCEAAP